MTKFTNPLDHVRVAAPCTADWGRMLGTERARFCPQCNLNVYNLSGMSKGEAEALLAGKEGRLCVRFYRRADGTILTENCPAGLCALKRRAARVAGGAISAVLSFGAGLGLSGAASSVGEGVPMMGAVAPAEAVVPPVRPVPEARVEMGDVVMGRALSLTDGGIPANKGKRRARK